MVSSLAQGLMAGRFEEVAGFDIAAISSIDGLAVLLYIAALTATMYVLAGFIVVELDSTFLYSGIKEAEDEGAIWTCIVY